MIILTTDNGTTRKITGNRLGVAVRGAKSLTSEPGVCIPFIVSLPGKITEGIQTDALVDFTDLLPTLIEAGGGDHSNLIHTIDGQSFYPLLVNEEDYVPRKWIMSMGGGNHARLTEAGVENQYLFRDRVVRNHRYKMYVNSNREAANFYDLMLDPLEKNNILDSLDGTLRSEQFDHLMRVAKSFPEEDNDPVYRPNPSQAWDVEITAESKAWKL